MPLPYIYVSERMPARVDRATPAGVATDTVEGYHAIWAATVPFIPAFSVSLQEAQAFGPDANSRIRWLLERQIRFLYALAQITNHQATFELRYVATPRPGMPARVTLVLLGKSFTQNRTEAELLAQAQWERAATLFPSEPPFHYPLVPVSELTAPPDTPAWLDESFAHWFEPLTDSDLDSGRYVLIEFRKHEDWPTLPFLGNAQMDVDYIPHPWVPPLDYTGMARLLETLSRSTRPAFVAVTLRPQRLAPREEVQLTELADWYDHAVKGEVVNMNPVVVEQRKYGRNQYDAYFRRRAELGKQVYDRLVRERQSLLLASVRAVAIAGEMSGLKEALGSELIANSGTEYPCRYEVVIPGTVVEAQWARFNMRWLEMERWGLSRGIERWPQFTRLRFLVSVPEAIAAFRLPTAPPDAQLDGIPVRDEPFRTAPTNIASADDVTGLGDVTIGGVVAPVAYRLPRAALDRGVTICGDDDRANAQLVATLLAQLQTPAVPTIVLGPQESATLQTIAQTLRDGAQSARSDREGEGTPVVFGPPPDVPPVVWADAVARGLALVYALPVTLCRALRQALVEPLISPGENSAESERAWRAAFATDGTAALATAVEHATTLDVDGAGDSASAQIRTILLPGLRELASLTPGGWEPLPESHGPLVIRVRQEGISEHLVARLALSFASAATALAQRSRAAPLTSPKGILVVMLPELLFPVQRANDQPLLPVLETLRREGCAVVLVSSRPQQVDREALAGGTRVVQRLTTGEALAVCQQLLQLREREARRLSILAPGETLWQREGVTTLVRQSVAHMRAIAEPGQEVSSGW